MKIKRNKNYTFFLALMTAFALSLYFFEMLIPQPLPFIKVGLSNIVVLVLVFSQFYKEALFVAFAKSFVGALVTGTIISPTFILSLSGACLSCGFMIVFYKSLKSLTIFGLSIVGAFVHLMTQLVMVRLILIKTNNIFSLYPLIVISAIITGFITGWLAYIFSTNVNLRSVYVKINN